MFFKNMKTENPGFPGLCPTPPIPPLYLAAGPWPPWPWNQQQTELSSVKTCTCIADWAFDLVWFGKRRWCHELEQLAECCRNTVRNNGSYWLGSYFSITYCTLTRENHWKKITCESSCDEATFLPTVQYCNQCHFRCRTCNWRGIKLGAPPFQ